MNGVVEELKSKLAELDARLKAIKIELTMWCFDRSVARELMSP